MTSLAQQLIEKEKTERSGYLENPDALLHSLDDFLDKLLSDETFKSRF
jgi:hypothetical protein